MMLKTKFAADATSYSTAINACAGVRDVARVEHSLSMMLKASVEAITISYNTVIKACAEARNMAGAEH